MDTTLDNVGFTLLAIVVACYGVVPLRSLWTIRMAANPAFEAVDPHASPLPAVVAEHLDLVRQSLEPAGFQDQGTLFLPRQMRNVTTIMTSFINRAAQDTATAVTVYAKTSDGWRTVQYLHFNTRYRSGLTIGTSNPKIVGIFPPRPRHLATRLPWISDPVELYRIHQAITAAKGDPRQKQLRVDEEFRGDVRAYFARATREEMEDAAAGGYLRLTADGTRFRATLKGAYLMTWKQLWPFKRWLAQARDRKAKRLLEELRLV